MANYMQDPQFYKAFSERLKPYRPKNNTPGLDYNRSQQPIAAALGGRMGGNPQSTNQAYSTRVSTTGRSMAGAISTAYQNLLRNRSKEQGGVKPMHVSLPGYAKKGNKT